MILAQFSSENVWYQRRFDRVIEVISNDQKISIPETLLVKRELCTVLLIFLNTKDLCRASIAVVKS